MRWMSKQSSPNKDITKKEAPKKEDFVKEMSNNNSFSKGSLRGKNVDQVWTMSVRGLTPPPLFSRVMDTVKHFFKIGYNGPIIPIYGAILAIHGAILAI